MGTLPHAAAHPRAPRRSTSAVACGADSVSFQSFAGRSTRPRPSSTTRPCCCAATATASTGGGPASAYAASNALHQAAGSCSDRGGPAGGCGVRPPDTKRPSSASRISTLLDCVDESTPETRPMSLRLCGSSPRWPISSAGPERLRLRQLVDDAEGELSVVDRWGGWRISLAVGILVLAVAALA